MFQVFEQGFLGVNPDPSNQGHQGIWGQSLSLSHYATSQDCCEDKLGDGTMYTAPRILEEQQVGVCVCVKYHQTAAGWW